MPCSTSVHDDLHLVVSRWSGTVGAPDLEAEVLALVERPGFRPGFRRVADLRAIETLNIGAAEMTALGERMESVLKEWRLGRSAVIADRDDLYGVARMVAAFGHDYGTEHLVCRTIAEADRWLGLDGSLARLLVDPAA